MRAVAQVLQEHAVHAAAKMPFQFHDSHPSVRALIRKRNEPASFAPLDSHLRHDRNSCAGSYHRQDGRELTTLKNHVGMQAGTSARCESIFAKAMALLEQEKRIALDLFKMKASHRCQPVVVGNDSIQALAKHFLAKAIVARDRQRKNCEVGATFVYAIKKLVRRFFHDLNLNVRERLRKAGQTQSQEIRRYSGDCSDDQLALLHSCHLMDFLFV